MTMYEAEERANRLVAGFIRGWLEAGGLTTYTAENDIGDQGHDLIAAKLDGIMVALRAREMQAAAAAANNRRVRG